MKETLHRTFALMPTSELVTFETKFYRLLSMRMIQKYSNGEESNLIFKMKSTMMS